MVQRCVVENVPRDINFEILLCPHLLSGAAFFLAGSHSQGFARSRERAALLP